MGPLHRHCAGLRGFRRCSAGYGSLIADQSGNLFGTTKNGGTGAHGVVFALKHRQKQWQETVLYNLCSQPDRADGAWGKGGLLLQAGTLFGTTANGGNCTFSTIGCGVLFNVAANGGAPQYSVLHDFCSEINCTDGDGPLSDLLVNASGTLFGVTVTGGGNNIDEFEDGGGTAYAYDGTLHVLHAFCAEANCTDGEYPYGGLVIDAAGNLFGAANLGGKYRAGVVYEISP